MTRQETDTVVPLRRPAVPPSIQGSLALDLAPRIDPPHDPDLQALLSPSSPPRTLDDARRDALCRRYLRCVVEVAVGDRPPGQLSRHTHPDVFTDLCRRSLLARRAAGSNPRLVRPRVRSIHISEVSPTAVEASVHARYGRRSRAVAARFELLNGRWQCTALEFA